MNQYSQLTPYSTSMEFDDAPNLAVSEAETVRLLFRACHTMLF